MAAASGGDGPGTRRGPAGEGQPGQSLLCALTMATGLAPGSCLSFPG